MMLMSFRCWIAGVIACLVIGLPARSQTALPEVSGKALTDRMCKLCHPISEIVKIKRTRDGWQAMVENMVSRGAQGTEAEISLMIEYLTKHFGVEERLAGGWESTDIQSGKIDVNAATDRELAETLGLTEEEANAIVRYREKNGNLKGILDFKKVPGLDLRKIANNHHRTAF
jgi:competence protein ComEA